MPRPGSDTAYSHSLMGSSDAAWLLISDAPCILDSQQLRSQTRAVPRAEAVFKSKLPPVVTGGIESTFPASRDSAPSATAIIATEIGLSSSRKGRKPCGDGLELGRRVWQDASGSRVRHARLFSSAAFTVCFDG
ncbi:hypothetical protein FDECE_17485 [Fusarium decemcellulare]|nr:hypothetical protein FDECE_17485 [Fusarium decemcellulare]